MDKKTWLSIAEIIDGLRIMPRVILASALGFAAWYIYALTVWYMALPAAERTLEVSGLAGLTIPAVFGLAGKIVDWYLKTGRTWKEEPLKEE